MFNANCICFEFSPQGCTPVYFMSLFIHIDVDIWVVGFYFCKLHQAVVQQDIGCKPAGCSLAISVIACQNIMLRFLLIRTADLLSHSATFLGLHCVLF